MLKINSAMLPASSRRMLATPPLLSLCTRCSGSRTACSKALRRVATCTRVTVRVAYQRPHSRTTVSTTETTITPPASHQSSCNRLSGSGMIRVQGGSERIA